MTKTIGYLEEKNNYLEKFIGLNRDWLERLSRGDLTDLENFRETRESILNIIRHIDALVETHSRAVEENYIDMSARTRINSLLIRKDDLVKVILSQDLEIMEMIEAAKSQIIIDLRSAQKTRKTLGSYKSGRRKETVDEEY
jgi:hypothetical protein